MKMESVCAIQAIMMMMKMENVNPVTAYAKNATLNMAA
jgi:hypothetical protein